MTKLIRLGISLAALAVFGAACSDDPGGPGGEVSTGEPPASGDSAASESESDDNEGDSESSDDSVGVSFADFESPIQLALGFSNDPSEQQDFYAEQERQRQQFVAECMAEQGFQYIPVDYSQFNDFSGVDFDEREYVEEFGFGISTQFDQSYDPPIGSDVFVDPNAEIVEAMSPAEQEAYNLALYGDSSVFEAPDGEAVEFSDELLVEQGGCFNEAYLEIEDPTTEFYAEFSDQLDELYQRAQADPRIVTANEQWSACMADAGHPYDDMEAMYRSIEERMRPFWELAYPSEYTDSFSDSGDEAAITDTASPVGFGPPELTASQRAELEELQMFELAVAAANYECQQDVLAVQFEVQAEYEQAFVDENRAAIDA